MIHQFHLKFKYNTIFRVYCVINLQYEKRHIQHLLKLNIKLTTFYFKL